MSTTAQTTPQPAVKTVAITGTTGFVGQNMLRHLLAHGWHVRALVRRAQPIVANVTWIEGDLSDTAALTALTAGTEAVIHLAGLTKALSRQAYFAVNADAVKTLADAAHANGVPRFILFSSMAARAPELSHYGASKRGGETPITQGPFEDWTVLRPPAIYGPGEREIAKIITLLTDKKPPLFAAMGGKQARASYIHVDDLCRAVLQLLAYPKGTMPKGVFEIDDLRPGGYSVREQFTAMSGGYCPRLMPLKWPYLWPIGAVSDIYSALTRKALMTSRSHLRYLSHPDWSVHDEQRLPLEGWAPQFDLFSGIEQTKRWNRENTLSSAERKG